MNNIRQLAADHTELTRRYFLKLGAAAAAAWNVSPLAAATTDVNPQLQLAIARLQYLTPVASGRYFDKGKTGVLKLPTEKLREIGLVPETWSLEVVADTASRSVVEQPLTRARGNALDWNSLMKLADKHAVRFLQQNARDHVDHHGQAAGLRVPVGFAPANEVPGQNDSRGERHDARQ